MIFRCPRIKNLFIGTINYFVNLNYLRYRDMLIYLKKAEKLRGNQLLHICTMIALLAISKQILGILQNLFLYSEIQLTDTFHMLIG